MKGVLNISHFPCSLLQLLLLSFAAFPLISASDVKIVLTASQPVVDFVTTAGESYSICLSQENPFSILSIFDQLSMNVVASDNYDFRWHSVKGVSSDDFHSNIEKVVYNLVGTDEEKLHRVTTSSDFRQSFFRDIVSSCPSPFFSTDRSQCKMAFSPFGEACIQVQTEKSVQLLVTAKRDLNIRLPLSMICGLCLLNSSQSLSKSSIFQVWKYFCSHINEE